MKVRTHGSRFPSGMKGLILVSYRGKGNDVILRCVYLLSCQNQHNNILFSTLYQDIARDSGLHQQHVAGLQIGFPKVSACTAD